MDARKVIKMAKENLDPDPMLAAYMIRIYDNLFPKEIIDMAWLYSTNACRSEVEQLIKDAEESIDAG